MTEASGYNSLLPRPVVAAARYCRGPFFSFLFFVFFLNVCVCVLHFFIMYIRLIFIDEKISYTRRKDDPQRKFLPRPQGLELAILCIGGRHSGPLLPQPVIAATHYNRRNQF